ncbi:cyclic nucleotide-gated ion channel 18-like isoform X2 [Cornus florida]|uniref:cyclic nucleotide-gated ion channel 18-like isoform X2 n=1 Tax=Cornus florida TaxID=4283 RepID=UPI0028A0F183|nr:cyclic nucleotide-gated ion channel 18-like isoform X2 [Cornus florida]
MNTIRPHTPSKIRHFAKPTLLIYDHDKPWWGQILDPGGEIVNKWNHIFLVACLVALFLDPVYFFLPEIGGKVCMGTDMGLAISITVLRSIVDLFSLLHMVMKFRTAYVAPSSRVFGKGELVMDPGRIAIRYLKSDFVMDLAATLPLPQLLGASWYVLSIERQYSCWRTECTNEHNGTHSPSCSPLFLDCKNFDLPERQYWSKSTEVLTKCDALNTKIEFKFGMFTDAFKEDVASSGFIDKYFYCLWWGLKNLCSYGQNLSASSYLLETLFCSLICITGLTLFALLIGNIQSYLQSTTARLEEWRVKRRDTEEWMRHRQLPPELQDRVRRFVQYKWLATRGVDEEDILRALPLDLRRQIQRHLCLALVRRVPFFSLMDDQLLDAICERLISSLSTKDTYIVREGDPVNEMLFIIRGQLESSTTNGGRSGFFNSITLKPGDFCGEELLTWALMPSSNINLPSSTRTVKSVSEVEAFALRAEDLKFVANQFKRLHSKKLQHAFRYYSHQWRTWGACFIQAAWRRYKRWTLNKELARQESLYYMRLSDAESCYNDDFSGAEYEDSGAHSSATDHGGQHSQATILGSKFGSSTRKGVHQKVPVVEPAATNLQMPKLFKPNEPDFSANNEDI